MSSSWRSGACGYVVLFLLPVSVTTRVRSAAYLTSHHQERLHQPTWTAGHKRCATEQRSDTKVSRIRLPVAMPTRVCATRRCHVFASTLRRCHVSPVLPPQGRVRQHVGASGQPEPTGGGGGQRWCDRHGGGDDGS